MGAQVKPEASTKKVGKGARGSTFGQHPEIGTEIIAIDGDLGRSGIEVSDHGAGIKGDFSASIHRERPIQPT